MKEKLKKEMPKREKYQQICSQLYQIIGVLACHCDVFETDQVQKALDVGYDAAEGNPVYDEDLLPFIVPDKLKEMREENTRLRAALAMSDQPCVYCTLPAEDFAKCQSGFPGCARADDQMGCPHLAAAFAAHMKDIDSEEEDILK